ncbi:AMMECR1 domain-containing protein, partial [Baffinella frigidus]
MGTVHQAAPGAISAKYGRDATDKEALEEQCRCCFDVIIADLAKTSHPSPNFPPGNFPLFVTWDMVDARNPARGANLRGCIGNLSAMDLHQGVVKYAWVSAFQDRRFSPISAAEVPSLQCSVTLLHNYEKASHCYDWQVGVHGMIIDFSIPGGDAYSATYLPSVCSDQGWTQEEC